MMAFLLLHPFIFALEAASYLQSVIDQMVTGLFPFVCHCCCITLSYYFCKMIYLIYLILVLVSLLLTLIAVVLLYCLFCLHNPLDNHAKRELLYCLNLQPLPDS